MNATLVVGLGGSLSGDDAIGLLLAQRLAADPRLPAGVDVMQGGADLLRLDSQLVGRRRVLLVDALQALPGESEPLVGEHPVPQLERRQQHAHHLSAPAALDLLLLSQPELATTRFTWFLVPVGEVATGAGISPELEARLPALLDRLLAELRHA